MYSIRAQPTSMDNYFIPHQYFNNDFKLKNKAVALYKTESCRNWTELGHCRYGKKCRYAHGIEELRAVPRHVRYKTQICRAYHMDGSCPYGIRCTFVHETMPLVSSNDRRSSFGSQDSSNTDVPYYVKQEKQFIETVYGHTNNNNMALWM